MEYRGHALAATWYCDQTLWVNRYHLPFEELCTQPTRTDNRLRDGLAFCPNAAPPIS